ncbi:MAG: hypothetical protein Q9168_002070 [Polycauliona sp. 1 TL-2023]
MNNAALSAHEQCFCLEGLISDQLSPSDAAARQLRILAAFLAIAGGAGSGGSEGEGGLDELLQNMSE